MFWIDVNTLESTNFRREIFSIKERCKTSSGTWQDGCTHVKNDQTYFFGSGKVIVFDSGFFVEKGVVELEDRGVYGG